MGRFEKSSANPSGNLSLISFRQILFIYLLFLTPNTCSLRFFMSYYPTFDLLSYLLLFVIIAPHDCYIMVTKDPHILTLLMFFMIYEDIYG